MKLEASHSINSSISALYSPCCAAMNSHAERTSGAHDPYEPVIARVQESLRAENVRDQRPISAA